MLKGLLYKEYKLSLHETNYIFLLMVFMLLIPSYPFYVAFFFSCLGIFYLFMNGREQNDLYFTILLPVRKTDAVKARFITVAGLQSAQVLLSIPFAITHNRFMVPNAAGIEANVAFYGLVLGMYTVFNLIFLPAFYKTGHKIGGPFILAMVAMFVYIVAAEVMVHLPWGVAAYLDTTDPAAMLRQLPVLLAGVVVYAGGLLLAYRVSARRFAQLDL